MMPSIFLTIYLVFVHFHHTCDASSRNNDKSKPCKVLPNGCSFKLVSKDRVHLNERLIYCQKLDERFDFDYEKFIEKENCARANGTNKIYFRLNKPRVLDGSLDLMNLRKFLDQLVEFYFYEITFKNLLGFDAQHFNNPIDEKYAFNLKIYSSPLNFYLKRTLINSCSTTNQLNYSSGSLFHALPFRTTVTFFQIKSSAPICPLLFRNMRFSTLELKGLVETFYKSNVPRFINLSNSSKSIRLDAGSKIRWLSLNDFTLVRLGNSLLNNIVFGQIADLSLLGEFESIEPGLLRSFNRLTNVNFIASLFSKRCRHRGMDWLTDLNYEIRYNLSDSDFWQNQDNNLKFVTINLDFTDDKKDKHTSLDIMISPWYFFPDEDFCVYQRFPFDQLLVLDFNFFIPVVNISCTYAWFIQYHQIYRRFVFSYMFLTEKYVRQIDAKIQKCDFKKRCNLIFFFYIIF